MKTSQLNSLNSSISTVDVANLLCESLTLWGKHRYVLPKLSCTEPPKRRALNVRNNNRPSKTDMICPQQGHLAASKDGFVVARRPNARDIPAQLLEKYRRQRLAKKAKQQAVVQMGIRAINGHKPLVTRHKLKVVGLPGLFKVDLLAKLAGEDQFLGPMRKAIINRDT